MYQETNFDRLICHCDCGSLRHILTIDHDKGKFNTITLYLTVRNDPLWRRIKSAIRYIFKGEQEICYFDLILKDEDLDELAKMIDTQQRRRHAKANVTTAADKQEN